MHGWWLNISDVLVFTGETPVLSHLAVAKWTSVNKATLNVDYYVCQTNESGNQEDLISRTKLFITEETVRKWISDNILVAAEVEVGHKFRPDPDVRDPVIQTDPVTELIDTHTMNFW